MNQENLSKILKIITIIIGTIGLVCYVYVMPVFGKDLAKGDMSSWYLPWLIFILGTAIPVYIALVIFWRLCADIQKDLSFTTLNAARLKNISILAIADVVYFFIGNIVMIILKMHHMGAFLASLIVDVIGIAVALATASLSHLVTKASKLREESELTI